MIPIRCLIVDDERLARLELAALLTDIGGCTVVAEAGNAKQALHLIPYHQPDLVFLDINMPGTNGFELLGQLHNCPPVIFVTAYDQYAIQAFEVHALDYLLKPVRPDRLKTSLERLKKERTTRIPQRIFIPNRSGGRFVKLEDIYLARAYDHYVRLYHPAGNDLLHQQIGRFAKCLPPDEYFQANRSEIIRLAAVNQVSKLSRGRYGLQLPNKELVIVSERRSIEWRRRFPG
ncbi:MAG: LytTR family DNA-binding domain-containing protein [Bacteroidota bacterium]